MLERANRASFHVSCSRDRLTFSKSILRRFIRDCVNRDAAVASPWVVKKFIADKYGVGSVMPDETRKGVENLRKGEMEKRKKAWEEKEGPSTKKQKKELERALSYTLEALSLADLLTAEKLKEPAPPPPQKKKKKPLRYPAEDMDVMLPERDKKAGAKVQRPVPSRELPFRETPGAFEPFLMAWNYLNIYGCADRIGDGFLVYSCVSSQHSIASFDIYARRIRGRTPTQHKRSTLRPDCRDSRHSHLQLTHCPLRSTHSDTFHQRPVQGPSSIWRRPRWSHTGNVRGRE